MPKGVVSLALLTGFDSASTVIGVRLPLVEGTSTTGPISKRQERPGRPFSSPNQPQARMPCEKPCEHFCTVPPCSRGLGEKDHTWPEPNLNTFARSHPAVGAWARRTVSYVGSRVGAQGQGQREGKAQGLGNRHRSRGVLINTSSIKTKQVTQCHVADSQARRPSPLSHSHEGVGPVAALRTVCMVMAVGWRQAWRSSDQSTMFRCSQTSWEHSLLGEAVRTVTVAQ